MSGAALYQGPCFSFSAYSACGFIWVVFPFFDFGGAGAVKVVGMWEVVSHPLLSRDEVCDWRDT